MAENNPIVVVVEGNVQSTGKSSEGEIKFSTNWKSSKAFLETKPFGVYSVVRITKSKPNAIDYEFVLWDFHLERLSLGLQTCSKEWSDKILLNTLQRVTREYVNLALSQWKIKNTNQEHNDLQLAILWSIQSTKEMNMTECNISIAIIPMHKQRNGSGKALVYGEGRINPVCKHSKWIQDRKPLEKKLLELSEVFGPIDEGILSNATESMDDRLLLEGYTSNFGVIKDGVLYTAGENVLHGTSRELLFRSCKDLKIPVILESPKLSECHLWSEAFVTNTLRVVTPIRSLICSNLSTNELEEIQLKQTSNLVELIQNHIKTKHYYL